MRRNSSKNPDTIVKHLVPVAEALRILKQSKNRAVYLVVRYDAPVVDSPGRVWPTVSTVRVPLTAAVEWVEKAFVGNKFEAQALIEVEVRKSTIFIG